MIRSTEEYISMFDATRRDAGNAGDAGAVREEEEERERRFEKMRESIGEERCMMMILQAGGDFAHNVKLMCEI